MLGIHNGNIVICVIPAAILFGGRHAIRPLERPGGTPDRLPFRTPGPAMPQDADADRQIDMAVIRKSVLVGIDITDTGTYEKRSPQGVGLPAHTRIV